MTVDRKADSSSTLNRKEGREHGTGVDSVIGLVAVVHRCFLLNTVIFLLNRKGEGSSVNHQKVTRLRMSRGRTEGRYEIVI